MPSKELIKKFIHAVETQPHFEVIEKFYSDDATIQENQNAPKTGKENLIKNERDVFDRASSIISKYVQPFFQDGDLVIIRWKFRFEWKNDTTTEIEELVYQEWENDMIKREQFFYDPKQMIPIQKKSKN